MNVRKKFYLSMYGGFLFLFITLFICGYCNFPFSLIIFFLFIELIGLIKLIETIKCPKCNTKLIDFFRPFSKYYKGFHYSLPKCCNCCGEKLV